jgi:hypothetical protein
MPETPAGFTVKEILTEIVIPDLKSIKAALDTKADRAEVVAIEVRLGHLETEVPTFVKRTGPVMDQIRDHERRLADSEKESIRRQAIIDSYWSTKQQVDKNSRRLDTIPAETDNKIRAALKDYDTSAEVAAEKQFSRRDKILLSSLGVIAALGTIISTIFLVISATGGGGGH